MRPYPDGPAESDHVLRLSSSAVEDVNATLTPAANPLKSFKAPQLSTVCHYQTTISLGTMKSTVTPVPNATWDQSVTSKSTTSVAPVG